MPTIFLTNDIKYNEVLIICECGLMVEHDLAKVKTGVRFSSFAPLLELPEHLNSSVR